jgi:hypothetical protein
MTASHGRIAIALGLSLLAANVSAQQPLRELVDTPPTVSPRVSAAVPAPTQGGAAVDPDIAFRRALLYPGGGHFYSGETSRGALFLVAAGGGLLAGLLLSGDGSYDVEKHEYNRGRGPLYAGAGVAAASYVVSLLDSRGSATRMNRRLGLRDGRVDARLGIAPDPMGQRPALAMRVSW